MAPEDPDAGRSELLELMLDPLEPFALPDEAADELAELLSPDPEAAELAAGSFAALAPFPLRRLSVL